MERNGTDVEYVWRGRIALDERGVPDIGTKWFDVTSAKSFKTRACWFETKDFTMVSHSWRRGSVTSVI